MDDYLYAGALGNAFKGAIEAWQNQEDRNNRKLEMQARMDAQKVSQERQRFMDGLTVRHQGFQVPEGGGNLYDTNPRDLQYDPEFLHMQNQKIAGDPLKAQQLRNAQLEGRLKGFNLNKASREADQASYGYKLPPDKVLQVQEGAQIPTMLKDVQETLSSNKDGFGPVTGRLNSLNPYNERAQTIDAQMRASSQRFGRYMEGGVLRKEDEDKYRKMFPQMSDTPEVAANKLQIVQKLLADKQNADIQALAAQGYDTRGFSPMETTKAPGILSRGRLEPGLLQSVMPEAKASGGAKAPRQGDVQDGYRFKGGNPADPKNWEKVR